MPRRLRVLIALASALVLLVGIAGAATVERARFTVTLMATLTKDWNVSRTVSGDCDRTTRYVGRWRLTVASRRPSRVVATAPARRRRALRFSRALVSSLDGSALQTGSTIVETRGAGCARADERRECTVHRRALRNAYASLARPQRRRLRLGRLQRASAARSLGGDCEPVPVRAIRPDLTLADGPLQTADVFAANIRRFFVSGDTDQVTTLEGEVEGRVVERVRWTLTFTRVRS